jgi:hypothetical protein
MATTEYDEPVAPTQREQVLQAFGHTVETVTDTDRSLPLRTWILVVIVGVCVLFAPVPINVIGVIATLALAMSAGARLRSR